MKKLIKYGISLYLLLGVCYILGFRFNASSSMPIGIYLEQKNMPLKAGLWVAACLNDSVSQYGLEHKYIKHGTCKNGSTPILKEIIAMPTDMVIYKNNKIIVNNKEFFAPQQPNIKIWFSTNRYQFNMGYWLYGSNNLQGSWDSRYFGPVSKSQIIGVFMPIITSGTGVH